MYLVKRQSLIKGVLRNKDNFYLDSFSAMWVTGLLIIVGNGFVKFYLDFKQSISAYRHWDGRNRLHISWCP